LGRDGALSLDELDFHADIVAHLDDASHATEVAGRLVRTVGSSCAAACPGPRPRFPSARPAPPRTRTSQCSLSRVHAPHCRATISDRRLPSTVIE
jgi:hypothetical protein